MDIEIASHPMPSTRFGKSLALLVGLAAVTGAVLATIEMDSRKSAERALLLASRISVDLYGRETAHQVVSDAEQALVQQARTAGVEAGFRRDRAALGQDGLGVADADAEIQAAARLALVASSVGRVPDASSGVDAPTRAAIRSSDDILERLEGRFAHQLALAKRLSGRRSLAVLALSLVALAGVLAGLAAVVGADRGGRVALALAAAVLLGALGCGVTSVMA